jgi:hypothetical protein
MAQEEGGVLWQMQPRQMNDRERQEYGVTQGQLAAICKGIRIADMEKFIGLGFAANQIFDMLAATGIAVAGQNESKHGRPAVWTALKRAEVDLYKQLFPTMMKRVSEAQLKTPDVVVDSSGPEWSGMEQHDQDFDPKKANEELFGPAHETAVDGQYEEIEPAVNGQEEPQPERQPEQEAPESQEQETAVEDDKDLAGAIADCRAWLEDKIKDGVTTLGMVVDASAMTPGYRNAAHAMNALKKYEGLPGGFKLVRNQSVTKDGALKLYAWLMERKEAVADFDQTGGVEQ